MCEEWQLYVANIEHGYDFARMAIDFVPGKPLPAKGARARIMADRGWQSSGLELAAGGVYRIVAQGRYQVAAGAKPWESEPGGVTIEYYHGQPLGVLLAAVVPETPASDDSAGASGLANASLPAGAGPSPLVEPIVVGRDGTLRPKRSGTLYLRVNDSAAKLADNAGALTVEVTKAPGAEK